jgi:sugar lactone lactonase YvrE
MSKAGRITKITPLAAIPGGEVFIDCEDFTVSPDGDFAVLFGGVAAQLVGASRERVVAIVPEDLDGETEVQLRSGADLSEPQTIKIAEWLVSDLHLVANPAFDSADQTLIVTRSGSRGQQLPVTMFRLDLDGNLEEISGDVMNPTGIAFDPSGQMFVTSRAEGTVYKITRTGEAVPFASDMGIATGIAFNQSGEMFVGDRAGTIYKVNAIGETEVFATLEQSIAAYHLAFGLDGNLYVTRPNVASHDSIMRVDRDGEVSTFFRGLGRPQGLAFDREGNLYVAASLRQRRGVVQISPDGTNAEIFAVGMNVVGLCFGENGEMFLATNESIYKLDAGIYGTLVS